jgi:hypothetical protein
MEDASIFPAQDPPPPHRPSDNENSAGKKIVYGFLVVLVLFAIGSVSFIIGRQDKSAKLASISPTPQVLSAPTAYNAAPTTTLTVPTTNVTPTLLVTPSPTSAPVSKVLTSQASLDGFRSSNNGGNSGLDIRAGRNVNLTTRGFVSFSLATLPSGANIVQATLRLYQVKVVGSPYTAGGILKVDHLNYGDSLDSTDHSVAALLSGFASLSSTPAKEWKEVDVTVEVKDDIDAARSRSQYRLHFVTETTGGDVTGDFVYFESADNSEGTGNTPQLVIKYN